MWVKQLQPRLLMAMIWFGLAGALMLPLAHVLSNEFLFYLSELMAILGTACLFWFGSLFAHGRVAKIRTLLLEATLVLCAAVTMSVGVVRTAFDVISGTYDYPDWASMASGFGFAIFSLAFCSIQWRVLWLLPLESTIGSLLRWCAFIAAWLQLLWVAWEVTYAQGPWDLNETLAYVVFVIATAVVLITGVRHLKRDGWAIKRLYAYLAIFSLFLLAESIWNADVVAYFLDSTVGDLLYSFDEQSFIGVITVSFFSTATGLIFLWESLTRDRKKAMLAWVSVSVVCPRCQFTQEVRVAGTAQCCWCGLKIRVDLEEARCECGYVLYQSPEKACPECGRLELRPSVTQGKFISKQSQVESALTASSENPGVEKEH